VPEMVGAAVLELVEDAALELVGTVVLELVVGAVLKLVGTVVLELVVGAELELVGGAVLELVGAAVLELVGAAVLELVDDAVLTVETVDVELDTDAARDQRLSLFDPPHISDEFPLQAMLQPVFARAPPLERTCPQ
jgi:hypothetical protein